MKQMKILAIAFCILVLITMHVGCASTETVTFPDGNLEAAIRDVIDKQAGEEITSDELVNLTTLDAGYMGITNLSGLEHCTNLVELNLIYNYSIKDISPLSNLTKLNGLWLYVNEISDISPLSPLINLTGLNLGVNEISDISALSSLTNLSFLGLEENEISDISPLSSLTNLHYLIISGNKISDISPLVENSGLNAGDELYLRDNNLDLTEGSEDMQNIKALQDRGVTVIY